MRSLVQRLDREVRAQDTLEWIMMTGLLAIAIVAAQIILGPEIAAAVTAIGECIDLDSGSVCAVGAFQFSAAPRGRAAAARARGAGAYAEQPQGRVPR